MKTLHLPAFCMLVAACSTAPKVVARADVAAAPEPTGPIATVDVARAVAPHARTALVVGKDAAATGAALAALGVIVKVEDHPIGREYYCDASPSPEYDLLVADFGDAGRPTLCGLAGEHTVRVSRFTLTAIDAASEQTYVDRRCDGLECVAFEVYSRNPSLWFTAHDLPLVPTSAFLSRAGAGPAHLRTATGLVTTTSDGRTFLDLSPEDGKPLLVRLDHPGALAPRTRARVTGSVTLDGTLGLEREGPDWKRPADAPGLFSPLPSRGGTVATMRVDHIDVAPGR